MLLPLEIFIPYFVALLVFFGIALLISFSKSSSETSQKREAELAPLMKTLLAIYQLIDSE